MQFELPSCKRDPTHGAWCTGVAESEETCVRISNVKTAILSAIHDAEAVASAGATGHRATVRALALLWAAYDELETAEASPRIDAALSAVSPVAVQCAQ